MPLVTSPAPTFDCKAVVDGKITELTWDQIHEGKWLVLLFYPLDFSPLCPTEIIAYSDAIGRFEKLGAKVFGISVDSQYSHLTWANTPRSKGGVSDLAFPLIADLNKSIAEKYGVLLGAGIALRGLFIIDPKGVVRHATINDVPIGRNVDETIRVIEAHQFLEKHGEVCPANWKPGEKAINPAKAKEYFEATYA